MEKIDLLARALFMAVVAPTEQQSKKAVELAENIAQSMTSSQVEQAKKQAEEHLK